MEKIITELDNFNKAIKNNKKLSEFLEPIRENSFIDDDIVELDQTGEIKVLQAGYESDIDGWVEQKVYTRVDVKDLSWEEWEEIEEAFLDEGIGSTAQY